MAKRRSRLPIIIFFIAAIIIVIVIVIAASRLTGKDKMMDAEDYFGIKNDTEAALIVDGTLTESKGRTENGKLYLPYDFVWINCRGGFYWDDQEGRLYATLPAESASWGDGEGAFITDGEGNVYIDAEIASSYSPVRITTAAEPERASVLTPGNGFTCASAKAGSALRLNAEEKSPVLVKFEEDTAVYLASGENGWDKVTTSDGFTGYMREEDLNSDGTAASFEPDTRFVYDKLSSPGIIKIGWHYVDNEINNRLMNELVNDTKGGINVISPTWFSVAGSNGELISWCDRQYEQDAHAMGLQIWALIEDMSYEGSTGELLESASARKNMIDQLMYSAQEYHIDGINIDFETIRPEEADAFIQFLRELTPRAHQLGVIVSVDNYVPKYTGYYQRGLQADIVDYIVVMAYDENTASAEEPGSVSTLPFAREGIIGTLEEVPSERLILGIPFYTRVWEETFGSDSLGTRIVGMIAAREFASEHGIELIWDASIGQNWGSSEDGSARYSVWMEDERSLSERIGLVKEYSLAGFAAWRLGNEDPAVWNVINNMLIQ